MDASLSILKLTSAMARHAAHQGSVTADNLARADIPAATGRQVEAFEKSLERADGPRILDSGRAISVEREMMSVAEAAGRHDAALSAWKSSLNLMRLALSRPE